jgi:hypothetical protein
MPLFDEMLDRCNFIDLSSDFLGIVCVILMSVASELPGIIQSELVALDDHLVIKTFNLNAFTIPISFVLFLLMVVLQLITTLDDVDQHN